jgi:pepF/M3 family oligoendopeptidase
MSTQVEFMQTWELDSLLPHPESDEFRAGFEEFRSELDRLAERSETLPSPEGSNGSVQEWAAFLREIELVSARGADLRAFVGCHAAADAQNKTFQRLEAQIASLEPAYERILTNIEYALCGVSDATFKRFVQADASLAEISFYLYDRRRNAELRLPKDQELLAADLAVDGLHAWGRLYDRISSELRIRVMERGEVVEKSPGQVQLDSVERSVRQNNFFAADKAWTDIADTCADALNHIAGTRLTLYRRLGLEDHLEVPLRQNRMRRESLAAMWSAVAMRKSTLLEYMNAKARLLGLNKLAWYDVLAPVAQPAVAPALSYQQACHWVLAAFGQFSPDLGSFAEAALRDRWVEAENRAGKRQGGFCTTLPLAQQSRIFMTFTNSQDSMSTLAHELGHAYHSWVLRDRSVLLRDCPMCLAETASMFAENVLGEERLRSPSSRNEELSILDQMLSDAVLSLMNIHARFIFEENLYTRRAEGELEAATLSELMLAAQREAYQDGLAEEGWYPNFWISKLHFYISQLSFYNFPYTVGYLLSLGLYALATESSGDFPARFRALLLASGCQDTEEAVSSTLGHDLTDAAFWNRALDVVDKRIARFLELSQNS